MEQLQSTNYPAFCLELTKEQLTEVVQTFANNDINIRGLLIASKCSCTWSVIVVPGSIDNGLNNDMFKKAKTIFNELCIGYRKVRWVVVDNYHGHNGRNDSNQLNIVLQKLDSLNNVLGVGVDETGKIAVVTDKGLSVSVKLAK